jgi:hypothetical protein
MIRARQTCFCGLFRSATTAANRSRSAALTAVLIYSRIAHYRTRYATLESYDCVGPLVIDGIVGGSFGSVTMHTARPPRGSRQANSGPPLAHGRSGRRPAARIKAPQ